MIDLHMHTTYTDGTCSVSELLSQAETKGLTLISITDHDCVNAYDELANPETRKLFSGKIITGVELGCKFGNLQMEILAYGLDPNKIKSHCENYTQYKYNTFVNRKFIDKMKEFGFQIENVDITKHCSNLLNRWLVEYKDFFDSINPNFTKDFMCLYRAFTNPNSPLCISFDEFYKSADEIIELIRKCGGLAFLSHPAEYKENKETMLEYFKDKVDGIECFHTSCDKEYSQYLVQFAQKNNLLISGGSDFHGKVKPNFELGLVAHGEMIVPNELLEWTNNIQNYKAIEETQEK